MRILKRFLVITSAASSKNQLKRLFLNRFKAVLSLGVMEEEQEKSQVSVGCAYSLEANIVNPR